MVVVIRVAMISRKRQLVDVKLEDEAVRSPKSPKSASHLSFLQVAIFTYATFSKDNRKLFTIFFTFTTTTMLMSQGRLADHLSPLQTGSAPPLPSTILVCQSVIIEIIIII